MPRKAKYKQRSDGRFEGKVQIGFKENGRPNRITLYAKTSLELEKKIDKLRYEVNNNLYSDDKGLTVSRYSNKWFETYKVLKSVNTKSMYQNIIEKHINEEIGHILLNELTKSDIQRLINSRADKYRTCEQIRMTLNQILNSAAEDNLIFRNPCTGIELPNRPRSDKRCLTDIEKAAIKKAEFTEMEKAFVYIIFGCGLRRGEAIALTKADINIKEGIISVNKAIAFDINTPQQKEPKSFSGYRDIDMPPFLVDYLCEYLKNVEFLLFTKRNGEQMTKSSYRKMWESIVKKMNTAAGGSESCQVITDLSAHLFRHNYCTMLYYSGISMLKAVQLMGHADSKMIMNIYTHLDEKAENVKEKIKSKIAL